MWLIDRTDHDGLAPSLHPHYRGFTTTTSQSANPPRIGTQHLAVSAAWCSPSHHPSRGGGIRVGLPTFRAAAADQARVAFMPDTTWPVSGHPPGSSREQPEAPVSMSCGYHLDTSTAIHSRSPSWSPPDASPAPSPHRSPPRPHDRRSMRRFEASPRRATPKGQTFINCTAPPSPTITHSSRPPTLVAHQVLTIAPAVRLLPATSWTARARSSLRAGDKPPVRSLGLDVLSHGGQVVAAERSVQPGDLAGGKVGLNISATWCVPP